ncbi:type II toxin-antitoxin system VapB family antitoxin [Microlunatus phosphovorus]|uniref:type II toxin-antitoxin system VapB family antitoxin n=1 Tax=Microlunatus phosphovorus TaxID=29405 RepID=UPI001E42A777|nr:ribbon-helix-helix protein, CopG family [Microlunatus phosphovorus]
MVDIVISSWLEVAVMTNVLIRGLSDSTVERIDAEASALGLSRNEFLRRKLEGDSPRSGETTTDENWRRAGEIFADLADPAVMADAWR